MNTRTKLQITLTFAAAALAFVVAARNHTHPSTWLPFWLLLIAILVSSGFKVALPSADSSMSLNYPFILLGIVQLSPLQAMLLAALSIAAQCRIKVHRIFTVVQIAFNVANAVLATGAGFVTFTALRQKGMALAPALTLASVSYFLVTTFAVALILSASSGTNPFRLWSQSYPWYLPFYLVGATLAALASWISLRFGWGTALLLIPLVYTLYRAYTAQSARLKERQQHLEETEALHLRTIEGLAMAIEAKDQGTHEHLFRVRDYVKAVGRAMQLSDLELRALETAAFLHDIGKLAVPEYIINKPGKLTPEEFEKMKIHPVVGADLLERVRFPYPVVPIVRSHHERWDGAGYPDGLSGKEIPLGARILTVIDCYDALVSDRPYRRGLPPERALTMLRELSGKQFDPEVVSCFERVHALSESEMAVADPGTFVPLNTEIQISRGEAPGAGYQVDAAEATGTNLQIHGDGQVVTEDTRPLAREAAEHTVEVLKGLCHELRHSLTKDELFALIFSRIAALIPFDTAALYLRKGDDLARIALWGEYAKQFEADVVTPLGAGISGWVAQSGLPILNGNAAVEYGMPKLASGQCPLRSGLAVPLMDAEKNVFATLTCYSQSSESFSGHHLEVLTGISPTLSLVVKDVLAAPQPRGNTQDFVKGLPDARRLLQRLEQAMLTNLASRQSGCIVLCELDPPQAHNADPDQKDIILRSLGEQFQQLCTPTDTVGRISGNTFIFLFPRLRSESLQEHMNAVRDIIEAAEERFQCHGQLAAALGYAEFPADGEELESLLSAANKRMYLDRERLPLLLSAAQELPSCAG